MRTDDEGHAERERILAFARRWYRYGGGDNGDILVEFGLSPDAYFLTLRDTLDTEPDGLDPAVRGAMLLVCYRRLNPPAASADATSARG